MTRSFAGVAFALCALCNCTAASPPDASSPKSIPARQQASQRASQTTSPRAASGSASRDDEGPANTVAREACVVTTVHDGDTFRCRGDKRVRLLLVDAPELDQPGGNAARDALRTLVRTGDTVWLEYDVARTDQYGRTLAYVWDQPRAGHLINLLQAEAGWVTVVVFPPNVRRVEEIRAAVKRAQAAHIGMWATGQVCLPIDHKKGRC